MAACGKGTAERLALGNIEGAYGVGRRPEYTDVHSKDLGCFFIKV
jgi:hypothetical protein